MNKLSAIVLGTALALGATAMLAFSDQTINPDENAEARLARDGAFRDGLYLGQFDARSNRQPRAAVGRWSEQRDRDAFVAGYRRGYSQSFAALEP